MTLTANDTFLSRSDRPSLEETAEKASTSGSAGRGPTPSAAKCIKTEKLTSNLPVCRKPDIILCQQNLCRFYIEIFLLLLLVAPSSLFPTTNKQNISITTNMYYMKILVDTKP